MDRIRLRVVAAGRIFRGADVRGMISTKNPDRVGREQSKRWARQGANAGAVATFVAVLKGKRPDGDLNSGPWLRKPRG